jgi:ABC-type transport system involved in multi-copper enzyme maturation permease subunit
MADVSINEFPKRMMKMNSAAFNQIISWPLMRYVLMAAFRDRLVLSFTVLVGVCASLSMFLANAAIVEADKFAVVYTAGGLRLIGMIAPVLFVSFYMRRAFDHKDVEFILSRPVGRICFLFSHAAAFMVMATLMTALLFIVMWSLTSGTSQADGLYLWILAVWIEFMIMVCAALFFSLVLTSAVTTAMVSFGFYALARLIGQLLGIVDSGLLHGVGEWLSVIMQLISMVVPRFDLMAQTSWLIYGASDVNAGFILMQGASFIALLLAASAFDFSRKQF